ncbi:MAG: Electron transport complex subunit RsxB [Chloroflexi bacterium]|nr:Electron transport complex subunit RsxB [Chloroflexota bacterium]
MMDVGRHSNIELLTYSEVEDISGYIGNFKARIRKKARYVYEEHCTSCGDCVEVCPVVVPDEYQIGLGSRRAIHIPFPQAVPSAYIVHAEECMGQNPIACGKCIEACEKDCIDFAMRDEIIDVDVGTVIVATGMEVYDPTPWDEYGYTRFPNVVTSMEFERLISTGGPLKGHLERPGDLKHPLRIGFIQCVGSRTQDPERGNPYCSNFCCMNTIKSTQYLNDTYPDIESTVFYMDLRAFGKGFEELLMRSKGNGVRYVRGLPGDVREDPETGDLRVTVENTTINRLEEHEFDMLVLAVGAVPATDTELVRQMVSLSKSPSGFLKEAHPKLRPVDTPTKGVFIAGAAESPKDVRESVTQASAAASRSSILLNKSEFSVEAITAVVDEDLCKMCGQCADVCPFSAIQWAKKEVAVVTSAACAGCGTCAAECRFDAIEMRHFSDQAIYAQIDAMLEDDPLNTIVTFACNWCSYAGADTAGVGRMAYPPNANIIRTMCSGRVSTDFVWYAFRKGAPVVLVSGCHYVDCHYIDANRSTTRRLDGLWDGLEKADLRPDRLLLEWCSAAEGGRWQTIMQEAEKRRQTATLEEVEQTRSILAEARTPSPRNPRARDEGSPAAFVCLRCGHSWDGIYQGNVERMCPQCRSNSVRWLRKRGR